MSQYAAGIGAFQSDSTVGAPCGAAGGAMYDPIATTSIYPWPPGGGEKPVCFLLSAPPIIISDLYMSNEQSITHVNTVFRVKGNQPALPTPMGLRI
jgi:hypothetical protein